MRSYKWQRITALLLSFAIVLNISMAPAFADEKETEQESTAAEEQVQEEEASEEPEEEEPAASEEEASEDGEEAEEKPSEEPEEPEEEPEPEEPVGGKGKYVKDVYIAYGKTEDEAKAWLRKNKWEPLTGDADFNAGKASAFDGDVAAVMGIRRTDNANEAITDMAVMNMKGGYSFPNYQELLKQKKTEINEYINTFIPVLEEYRKNYEGEGSAAGKVRAELAHELLNNFYDGGKDEPYAVNDTGKPLGDLFLSKIRQEEGGEKGGDLQQILLESSGPAATLIEVCLALSADAGKDTWLERLQKLSGDDLSENLEKYVPEAKGQDIAPSAAKQFLKQHFGDQAKILASQWSDLNKLMKWFESYNDKNDLWKHDGEKDESYGKRISQYFEKLDKETESGMHPDHEKYMHAVTLYTNLYGIPYEGEWGESLGDFFNPAEGSGYSDDTDKFLPFAAALSEGQRAAVSLVSLESLLTIGMGTEESIKELFPQAESVFDGAKNISIYSGMNRGIFRGGVALTDAALVEKNRFGLDPFSNMWIFDGMYNLTTYVSAVVGLITVGVGAIYLKAVKTSDEYIKAVGQIGVDQNSISQYKANIRNLQTAIAKQEQTGMSVGEGVLEGRLSGQQESLNQAQRTLERSKAHATAMTRSARIVMGVGGAMIIAAAMAKGYQLYRFYNKTFTQIPTYIVDEADIVSYKKDNEGNEVKLIDFDQFVYYAAVKCNRQEVGQLDDWQDGVSDYASWGCGDVADLNGDFGLQWLALYTVKSPAKGYPILADSLILKYGNKKMPKGCSKALHLFTLENAFDIGDTRYAYNNDKDGIYFFWDSDKKAYDAGTASAFANGKTAMAGGLGLLIGILGTSFVMKRKREDDK